MENFEAKDVNKLNILISIEENGKYGYENVVDGF